MKKIKLTLDEKRELKQEKKSWAEMLRRLTKKGAIVAGIVLILASCSSSRYYSNTCVKGGRVNHKAAY